MGEKENELLETENSFNNTKWLYDETISRLNLLAKNVLNTTWDSVLRLLSDWQKDQLMDIDSESGVECLLKMWFQQKLDVSDTEMAYCNATWENDYCWPPAAAGEKVMLGCIGKARGEITRACLNNGTWSQDYTATLDTCEKRDASQPYSEANGHVSIVVGHMVFVGSIISLVCLGISLIIFYCLKSTWTQRVTLQIHLMLVLILRFILLCIISEPVVSNRSDTYRTHDFICKFIISAYLYLSVALVMWMLVQGIYLNRKLTTNVMGDESRNRIRFYYFLGWLFPAAVLVVYLLAMIVNQHKGMCWKGYPEMIEIWIVLAPILFALMLNALFLLNILRVVIYKSHEFNSASETSKFISIAKATGILFPVLGINNMLLIYNPGGEYEKYFVFLNSFFGSTQGILVAIVYCFMSKDVQQAISLSYNRFLVRRGFDGAAANNYRGNILLRNIQHRQQQNENNSETDQV